MMNSMTMLLLDIMLCISVLGLAWATLTTAEARRSVILFIAFGLVLALVWARLLAPDVALAEAAIGAGLSGALLLAAVRQQSGQVLRENGEHKTIEHERNIKNSNPRISVRFLVGLLCIAFAVILGWSLLLTFKISNSESIAQAVSANLSSSGVSNPVTAVLLNFRAYDTLLELAVLLTAILGIISLSEETESYRPAGPVLAGLVSWLIPMLILAAGYLLWVGAHAPGGAFQAGATLAAAGVVLRLAGKRNLVLPQGNLLRLVLVIGVAIFLLVGLSMLALGRAFLAYPPALAGALILLIETAAMLSIAATLILAFFGGRAKTTGDRAC